jgi:hypothetical protein
MEKIEREPAQLESAAGRKRGPGRSQASSSSSSQLSREHVLIARQGERPTQT